MAGSADNALAMVRFNFNPLDGTYTQDNSFGVSGKELFAGSGNASAQAMQIEAITNNLVLVGNDGANMLLRRYNSNGVFLESPTVPPAPAPHPLSFTAGNAVANACFIQEGNIILAGTAGTGLALARLHQ